MCKSRWKLEEALLVARCQSAGAQTLPAAGGIAGRPAWRGYRFGASTITCERQGGRPLLVAEGVNVDRDGLPADYGIARFAFDRAQIVFES